MAEESIKLEVGIAEMKKEYRRLEDKVASKKVEIASMITMRESIEKEVEMLRDELTEITNQIAKKQLDWAKERDEKLREIEDKRLEAEAVLKEKAQLETLKNEIIVKKEENASILNDNKRVLLDIDAKNLEIASEKKELERKEVEISNKYKELELKKLEFAQELKKLVENYVR